MRLLELILPKIPNTTLLSSAEFGHLGYRVDIAFRQHGRIAIVEVRGIVPQTTERLIVLMAKLAELRSRVMRQMPGENVRFILAIPGALRSRIEIGYSVDGKML
jgi:hypothetical protein